MPRLDVYESFHVSPLTIHCSLADITGISTLDRLELLDLQSNPKIDDRDLHVIGRLGALRSLNLDGCPIVGEGLVHLSSCHNLTHLGVSDCPKLGKVLPNSLNLEEKKMGCLMIGEKAHNPFQERRYPELSHHRMLTFLLLLPLRSKQGCRGPVPPPVRHPGPRDGLGLQGHRRRPLAPVLAVEPRGPEHQASLTQHTRVLSFRAWLVFLSFACTSVATEFEPR